MAAGRARPWDEAPPARLAAVAGVFTDIDDTLTRQGAIEPEALDALQALHAAGVPVIAVTGRPLGWCRAFAAPPPAGWPVRAFVAENGGVALVRGAGGEVATEYAQDAVSRAAHACRLRAALDHVLAEVPGARAAQDSAGRVTDIAIDHAEHAHLGPPEVERVVALLRGHGLTVTVSSIHVNAWVGSHSKWTGARWMLRRLFGRELAAEVGRWLYVGDSANDEEMFARFPLAVGVANLRECAARLRHWPAWITAGERGRGFAEVAAALLAARRR